MASVIQEVYVKGVDLVVARRFKRQGMRAWSRDGADNLLALRVLAMDEATWRNWWGEAAD